MDVKALISCALNLFKMEAVPLAFKVNNQFESSEAVPVKKAASVGAVIKCEDTQ